MRTVGIDLAAQPANTGACLITWRPGRAVAEIATAVLDDDELIRLVRGADLVGVDAPLGWPAAFVAAVTAHERGEPWPVNDVAALRYRLTDREVIRHGVGRPLSVSSDLLAVCAFRAARLQARLVARDGPPARHGTGPLAEVYPAGALRAWGLPAIGYKGSRGAAVRGRIADGLAAQCPWLAVDRAALVRRDHDLDALVCALVARAVATGRTRLPAPDQADVAAVEGWIHVPTGPLEELNRASPAPPDRRPSGPTAAPSAGRHPDEPNHRPGKGRAPAPG